MYDTRFFMDTYSLKRDITSGRYRRQDAPELLKELNRHLLPRPLVFNIETTNHCNMRCIMCQRTTSLRKPPQAMTDATFHTLVNQMTPQQPEDLAAWTRFVDTHLRQDAKPSENNFYYDVLCRAVILHGFGEPLLDPALPERVAALTARGIPTYFSCNPSNLRLPMIRRLFAAGLGWIKVALDALNDDEQKRLRGANADYTRAMANIRAMLALKQEMNAATRVVVTKLNFGDDHETDAFMALWEGEDVYAYVKSLDNQWLLANQGEPNRAANTSHYKRQYCEYAWTSVTILADGSVVPCTQDLNGEWTFGNVNHEPLETIWHSEKYQRFRELQVSGRHAANFMCHARCDLDVVATHLLP